MDIRELTALEIGHLIKERKLSSPEATRVFLDASKKDLDKPDSDTTKLNAYTEIYEESAMAAAEGVQERIDKGEYLSPFSGVPMALKDNICSTEGTTTAASKILGGFRSPYDATAAIRLREAGAVIIGKTNMDEFAMGSTTENSCYGPTRNPWDTARVPGGSSGGSAAAVAAGLVPYALGSDTGGSVRQPAGFCNLTGIKPTYGSVSRYGLIAYASSLDQIGPIAKDARDCAVILSIISGRDGSDSTSAIMEPFRFCGAIHGEFGDGRLEGRTIGLPASYFNLPALNAGIKACVLEAAETFKGLGAEVKEIDIPLLDYGVSAYLVLACAEAASNLARYDGIKYGYRSPGAMALEEIYSKTRGEGFGAEAKRRILFGYHVLSSENFENYYRKAQKARTMIKRAYDNALDSCDLVLAPVSPVSAYWLGAGTGDPLEIYIGDIFTASVNLTGLPAAAAPCGFDEKGMPIGMQLIGGAFSEGMIIDAIARYQQATGHHKQKPPCLQERGAS